MNDTFFSLPRKALIFVLKKMVLRQKAIALPISAAMVVAIFVSLGTAGGAINYYIKKDEETGKRYAISSGAFGGVALISALLFWLFK